MVRRDCENKNINLAFIDHIEKDLASRSARAYLRGGLPVLALLEILKTPTDYNLRETAVKGYLSAMVKNCSESHLTDKSRILLKNSAFLLKNSSSLYLILFTSKDFGITNALFWLAVGL